MNEWIDVKNKLPSPEEEVLLYHKEYGLIVGWLISKGNEITHWMPLPNKPQEQYYEKNISIHKKRRSIL